MLEWPFPSLGDLPDRGIEPTSCALAGGFFTTEPPGKPWRAIAFYKFSIKCSVDKPFSPGMHLEEAQT